MAGEIRSQFSHIIDIAPTILEAARVTEPTMVNGVKQTPIEGTSLVYTFDDAKAPTRHKTQYFEMLCNRPSITTAGWPAPRRCACPGYSKPGEASKDPDDFSGGSFTMSQRISRRRITSSPKEIAPQAQGTTKIFEEEAKKYHVYPLDASFAEAAT